MKKPILNVLVMLGISITTIAQTQLNDPLPFLGNVTEFAISPDETTVVYRADQNTDDVFELFSVPIDGGKPIRLNADLPDGGDVLEDFQISPDGSQVIYRADQITNGVFEIFSVPIQGGTPVRLNEDLPTSSDIFSFLISANSQIVVYRGEQDGNNTLEIFAVPIAGGGIIQLNNVDGDVEDDFQISADSSTVLYRANQVGGNNVISIFSVSISGGVATQLNPDFLGTESDVTNFQISPDSNTVLYRADQIANSFFELFAVPINGGTPIRLNSNLPIANGGGDVEEFAISADSNTVVYRADQITTNLIELFVVPITGGTPLRLNPDLGGTTSDVFDFTISPNGTTVVYRAEQNIASAIELFSVPIAGGTSIRLNGTLVGAGDVFDFQISADSQQVIYRADQNINGVRDLFTVPITGGEDIQLNNGGEVSSGDYRLSDDSSTVVFRADQNTNNLFELFGASIFGGEPVALSGTLIANGDTFSDFRVTSNGSQLVYRADQEVDEEMEVFSTSFDVAPPIAVCQPVTAFLNEDGTITIAASSLDGSSTDNVGVVSFALDTTSFSCDDLGDQTVTLTVSDAAGNSDSCITTVTIEDTIAPVIDCPLDDVTVMEDETGFFTVTDFADGIVIDNCDELTITQDPPVGNTLTAGTFIVTINATDGSNNETECSFTLIVDESLSVDENGLSPNTINLYPNPASSRAQLEYTGSERLTTITILDINGRVIQQVTPKPSIQIIDLNLVTLSTGLYLIEIASTQTTVTQKLLVQ